MVKRKGRQRGDDSSSSDAMGKRKRRQRGDDSSSSDAMGKRKRRQRGDDSSSSDASSSDGMSTEETRSTRSSGNHAIIKAIRKTGSKEAKGIKRMLKEHKDELKRMLEERKDELKWMLEERKEELKDELKRMLEERKDEHKDELKRMLEERKDELKRMLEERKEELKDELKRMLEERKDELKDELKRMLEERKDERTDETSGMKKELKKLNENQIVLCTRLEQLNGSSGDVSPAPRSEPNQMQLPRFRLRITSKVKDKVGKGESILTEHGDSINIVLYDGGNVIANDHPLASALVMMVVLNGEFNKGDIKYNWSKEDFQKSIRRPREGNSATGDVNNMIESTVIDGTFNLVGGSCSHRDAKISENSSNKKVRLGVMVMSTEERVLEGLSNRFLVRDPPKKSKSAPVDGSSTLENSIERATRSSTPGNSTHREHLQCPVPVADQPSEAPVPLTMFLPQPPSNTEVCSSTATMNNMMDPNGVHPWMISNISNTPMYTPPGLGYGDFPAADSEHASVKSGVHPYAQEQGRPMQMLAGGLKTKDFLGSRID